MKLSSESLQELGCSAAYAYTLAYSNEKKQQYLIEKEVDYNINNVYYHTNHVIEKLKTKAYHM